jgi:hypothetical protein
VDVERTENIAIPEVAHAVRVCTTQQTVLLSMETRIDVPQQRDEMQFDIGMLNTANIATRAGL